MARGGPPARSSRTPDARPSAAFAEAAVVKGPPPRLRIEVDRDRCAGNGMCLDFAPGVFAYDSRRRAEVVDPEGDALEDILVAAENCPTAAIGVTDAATGEPYEV